MSKKKEYTGKCGIMRDGKFVELSELSDVELAELKKKWSADLSGNMSDYYTQHPDVFARTFQGA